MKVSVSTRSGKGLGDYDLASGATVVDLQKAIHSRHAKLHPHRQRLYATNSGARGGVLKGSDALKDGDAVICKDLGPQISWKMVFIIEYLGPLLLYPLFYSQPRAIYGDAVDVTQTAWAKEVQFSALIAWSIHYAKREMETLCVHRFSHATMPFSNLFKNCGYYWGFAAWVAFFVNHPLYTPPKEDLFYTGMCLFYLMEMGNLSSHITLRSLRPAGTRVRRIPHGGLFEFVTCPNYTYEIMSWVGFNLMTKTVAGILFMAAGALQMLLWAQNKHRNYKKEFDGKDGRALYPKNRKILIPFVY